MKKLFLLITLSGAFILSASSFAYQAPVEDSSRPAQLQRPHYLQNQDDQDNDDDSQPQRRPLTFQQRIYRLEQQVQNLYREQQRNQLEEMQEQLAQLRGELDNTKHELSVLTDQQKKFYSDLNSRIGQHATVLLPQAISGSNNQNGTSETLNNNSTQQQQVNNTPVTPEESTSYTNAFNLLKSKQYDEAIAAFQKYLMEYPTGHYVVNSNYWLGEVYYLQGKAAEAKKAFTVVVTNFPNSQKISDALLKLAIIALDAGDTNQGRELLNKVKEQYSGTTAARLAALRLQELSLSS